MYKELWFEDGYYTFGYFDDDEYLRRLKNYHGLVVRQKSYK